MIEHSDLLKRFAFGELDILSALKILKILLKDFKDKKLIKWVECEICGYHDDDPNIPNYRKTKGYVYGNIKTANAFVSNQPLPIFNVPEDQLEALLTVAIYGGVEALQFLSKKDTGLLVKPVPVENYSWFNGAMECASVFHVYVRIDQTHVANILANIENKVLDIFYLLEQKGCNLDKMDISGIKVQSETIINSINELVYSDNSITIGNNNELSKTTLQTQA